MSPQRWEEIKLLWVKTCSMAAICRSNEQRCLRCVGGLHVTRRLQRHLSDLGAAVFWPLRLHCSRPHPPLRGELYSWRRSAGERGGKKQDYIYCTSAALSERRVHVHIRPFSNIHLITVLLLQPVDVTDYNLRYCSVFEPDLEQKTVLFCTHTLACERTDKTFWMVSYLFRGQERSGFLFANTPSNCQAWKAHHGAISPLVAVQSAPLIH